MSRAADARRPAILWRVAAGPRLGFGHLVRTARLARALGTPHARISLRGGAVAREVASGLGLRPVARPLPVTVQRNVIDLVVVDDPNPRAARAAVAAARRRGVVTASLHDLGLAHAGADFGVDGSAAPGSVPPGRTQSLVGARYAVLDPRCGRPPAARGRTFVLVALGGGPRRALSLAVARAIAARRDVEVVVALGFLSRAAARLPPGVRCVAAREGLADLLRGAVVAVTAGGLTALEAAACATPLVATAVVDAQRPTTEALARAGAAIDAGRLSRAAVARVAWAVGRLLDDGPRREAMGRAGRRFVDGRGTSRVAAAIRRWAR